MTGGTEKRSAFLSKASLDSSELNQSEEEKRKLVEKELRALKERGIAAGLNEKERIKCAEPFVECARRKERMVFLQRLVWLSLLVSVCSGVLLHQKSCDWITTQMRLFSVRAIKPYWDFTIYYNDQCIVNNPLYDESAGQGELDCSICKELKGKIEHLQSKDADPQALFDDFLLSNAPVIIHKAVDDWKATTGLTIEKLAEMYTTDPVLSKAEVCDVTGLSSFDAIMKRLKNPQKTKSMNVVWQNCDKAAYKQFRKWYRRPSFLPPAAEAVHTNFAIVSMGQDKTRTRSGTVISPSLEGDLASWIAQVKGKLEYTLFPVRDCAAECKKPIKVTMNPGDYLLVPLEMWEVSFNPVSSSAEDAIALGSGLMWDTASA